jgi:hypothetical protein
VSSPSTPELLAVRGKLISTTHEAGYDWSLNACVGNNTGSRDNSGGYSAGFQSAAEIMLRILNVPRPPSASETWGGYPLVDVLVYPLCYCARHHVELVLKASLPKAWAIFKIKSPHEAQGMSAPRAIEKTHSILEVWTQLHALCEKGDSRLSQLTAAIHPYILDIDSIDASGQTFRYAADAEDGARHLDDLSHINLGFFAHGYAELCELLERLEMSLDFVRSEMLVGSFTVKLNRDDLYEIARMLPHVDQWKDPSFAEIKQEIRGKYGLGSKDFQKACDKIKSTRTLSWRIGILKPIDGLSRDVFSRLKESRSTVISESQELSLEQRSAIFGLISICSPNYLPEEFDSFLAGVPDDPDEATHFMLEREQGYLARKVAGRPDLFRYGLRALGQHQLLDEFDEVYKEEIERFDARSKGHDEGLEKFQIFMKGGDNVAGQV